MSSHLYPTHCWNHGVWPRPLQDIEPIYYNEPRVLPSILRVVGEVGNEVGRGDKPRVWQSAFSPSVLRVVGGVGKSGSRRTKANFGIAVQSRRRRF